MIHLSVTMDEFAHDIYLPDQETWNEVLFIPQRVTQYDRDLELTARSLDGECFLMPPKGTIWADRRKWEEHEVQPGNTLEIIVPGGKRMYITPSLCEKSETLMQKYLVGSKQARIGSDAACTIVVDDPMISPYHGTLVFYSPVEASYQDTSAGGSCINGRMIRGGSVQLRFGDLIRIGNNLRILYLGNVLAINAPAGMKRNGLSVWEAGEYVPLPSVNVQGENLASSVHMYQRPPRMLEMPEKKTYKIENPMQKAADNDPPMWMQVGPLATSMIPMMLSSLIMQRNMAAMLVMMGGSAILGATWGMVNSNYRKKNRLEMEQKRQEKYTKYVGEMEEELRATSEQELARLRDEYLSSAQCMEVTKSKRSNNLEMSIIKTHRMWERTPAHVDFTAVRIGTGRVNLPADINISEEKLAMIDDELRDEPKRLLETYQQIENAPISIRLWDYPIVGILSPDNQFGMMQNMIVQLAAEHSYHDLRIVVLSQSSNRTAWEWARWLPHTYADDERSLRMVGTSSSSVQTIISHLENVLNMRRDMQGDQEQKDENYHPIPHYVIFCTSLALMDNQPILRRISENPMGFTMVMQASSAERLPKETHIIMQTGEKHGAVYDDAGHVTNVTYEYPDTSRLMEFSKILATYKVNDSSENSAIPSLVTFMEVYHARSTDDLDVWRFWHENNVWEGLKAIVGLRSGAKPFVLDISDKAQSHGPHGLVAGTTGSGKSVMLQTYILSLALNYHPNQVQFLLIDYKGGGTAIVFSELPHIAGIIDNQDGFRTIQRALQSIQGEINRRESMFKEAGVDHIDDYIQQFNNEPGRTPLAHLIIIVDEFAEMKREQPEFMKALISTARVGRTLGIHLILATQKPSNSVDDEIWSNTRFRICLRVAGKGDSNDMLKRPDAAYLRGMGRCYVQVGLDEIFEQVQTSYSGAAYAPNELTSEELPHILNDAGQPMKFKKKKKKSKEKEETQMSAVMKRIISVAQEHGVQPAKRLWLEELKKVILLSDLTSFSSRCFDGESWKNNSTSPLLVPYGMLDNVAMQRHEERAFNLTDEHNVMIVAPAGMGKTTALQTIAMSLAMMYTPDQVNLYIFSMTSNALMSLRKLPHVGEVVQQDEQEEALRLIHFLVKEDKRRQKLFEEANSSSFDQYNRAVEASGNGKQLPAIVVMADRMAQLLEIVDDETQGILFKLILEAASRGIYFIVTTLSMAREEMSYKISPSFEGVAIQQPDRDSYKTILGNVGLLTNEQADIANAPGRGLGVSVMDGNGAGSVVCEFQFAIFGSEVDFERVEIVRKLADQMDKAWKGSRPKGIFRIPENFDLRTFRDITEEHLNRNPYSVPLALEKKEGTAIRLDMLENCSMLIQGPARGGKTNMLLLIAEHAVVNQGQVVYLQQGNNTNFKKLAESAPDQVTIIKNNDAEAVEEAVNNIIKSMNHRNQVRETIEAVSKGEAECTPDIAPIVLLIDDAASFIEGNPNLLKKMSMLCVKGQGLGTLVAVTMLQSDLNRLRIKEPINTLCSVNCGFALTGRLMDANPWSVMASMDQKRMSMPVGEGFYVTARGFEHTVIPIVEE